MSRRALCGLLVVCFLSACASRLSETKACNMAKEAWRVGVGWGVFRWTEEKRRSADNYEMGECKDFESNTEQGWAKITLPWSYEISWWRDGKIFRTDHENEEYHYTFRRTDQGWKIKGPGVR